MFYISKLTLHYIHKGGINGVGEEGGKERDRELEGEREIKKEGDFARRSES